SWIRKMFESRRPRTAPPRRRLFLEALEDRVVPTVSFGPAVAYGTGGPSPHSVTPVELGGYLDPVTVDPIPQVISLLYAGGNGVFQMPQTTPTHDYIVGISYSPSSLAVGDFDGNLDVATGDIPEKAVGTWDVFPENTGQAFGIAPQFSYGV